MLAMNSEQTNPQKKKTLREFSPAMVIKYVACIHAMLKVSTNCRM